MHSVHLQLGCTLEAGKGLDLLAGDEIAGALIAATEDHDSTLTLCMLYVKRIFGKVTYGFAWITKARC